MLKVLIFKMVKKKRFSKKRKNNLNKNHKKRNLKWMYENSYQKQRNYKLIKLSKIFKGVLKYERK